MVKVLFVGNVAYADVLWELLTRWPGLHLRRVTEHAELRPAALEFKPDLIIVGGWRRLVPPDVLAVPRLGTVGFHSAKLPEFPGRAPVPWTLLRGDEYAWNTLLYLDAGVDSGDIVDTRRVRVGPGETPGTLSLWVASSSAAMLRDNLPGLLDGTAPRVQQDPRRRGPLTTADGWQVWAERHP